MTQFLDLSPGDLFVVVTPNGETSSVFKICDEESGRKGRILFRAPNGQWSEYKNSPTPLIGPLNEPLGNKQGILIKGKTTVQRIRI